jgi:hypothetical protein
MNPCSDGLGTSGRHGKYRLDFCFARDLIWNGIELSAEGLDPIPRESTDRFDWEYNKLARVHRTVRMLPSGVELI